MRAIRFWLWIIAGLAAVVWAQEGDLEPPVAPGSALTSAAQPQAEGDGAFAAGRDALRQRLIPLGLVLIVAGVLLGLKRLRRGSPSLSQDDQQRAKASSLGPTSAPVASAAPPEPRFEPIPLPAEVPLQAVDAAVFAMRPVYWTGQRIDVILDTNREVWLDTCHGALLQAEEQLPDTVGWSLESGERIDVDWLPSRRQLAATPGLPASGSVCGKLLADGRYAEFSLGVTLRTHLLWDCESQRVVSAMSCDVNDWGQYYAGPAYALFSTALSGEVLPMPGPGAMLDFTRAASSFRLFSTPQCFFGEGDDWLLCTRYLDVTRDGLIYPAGYEVYHCATSRLVASVPWVPSTPREGRLEIMAAADRHLGVTPQGALLALIRLDCSDNWVLEDVVGGRALGPVLELERSALCAAVAPSRGLVARVCRSGALEVWQLPERRLVLRDELPDGSSRLRWDGDGRYLAAVGPDRQVRVYPLTADQPLEKHAAEPVVVSAAPPNPVAVLAGLADQLAESADRLEAIADDPSPDAAKIVGSRTTPREGLLGVVMNLRDAAAALRTGRDPEGSPIRPDEVGAGLLQLHQVCDQAGWILPVLAVYKQHREELTDRLNHMTDLARRLTDL